MKKYLRPSLRLTLVFFSLLACAKSSKAQSSCDSLTMTYIAYGPSCYGGSNGMIDLTASGGALPYSFSWNTAATTEDLTGLPAANYTVVVTDGNGCLDTALIVISQPSQLVNTLTIQNVPCNGGSTGMIFTSVSGGTDPYIYSWSNGLSSPNLIYMPAGTYVITVTDYLGCVTRDTAIISQPDPLNLTISSPEPIPGYNISTYLGNDGSIDLTVTGGTAPYTYLWSNSSVTEDLNTLTAGPYSVTVTDANLCSADTSIVLDQPLSVEMPTGFTPNSDGNNDLFIIRGIEGFEENLLTIFNRWGNIVYQKHNYDNLWNGYNDQGEELADGTYFAILEIKKDDIILKSYVELKRHQ